FARFQRGERRRHDGAAARSPLTIAGGPGADPDLGVRDLVHDADFSGGASYGAPRDARSSFVVRGGKSPLSDLPSAVDHDDLRAAKGREHQMIAADDDVTQVIGHTDLSR